LPEGENEKERVREMEKKGRGGKTLRYKEI
jgi:hypothetical protein